MWMLMIVAFALMTMHESWRGDPTEPAEGPSIVSEDRCPPEPDEAMRR